MSARRGVLATQEPGESHFGGLQRAGQAVRVAFLSILALACALTAACSTKVVPRSVRRPVTKPSCHAARLAGAIARLNSTSLYLLHFAPFGRPEQGWATYAPLIETEVGSGCAADTDGFAAALARWQRRERLPATGVMTADTFEHLKTRWQDRRPFVALRAKGVCPAPPSEDRLADARPDEAYGGKPIQLRSRALTAYRRMVADARRQQPTLAANPELLTIFSAYRSPAYDAARCARDANCQGVVRAACSAHRTGLAFDLVLDTAPGYPVDSSADPNRLAMANGLAYRWLVGNAGQYGFINYSFEPWHWEWTGERP